MMLIDGVLKIGSVLLDHGTSWITDYWFFGTIHMITGSKGKSWHSSLSLTSKKHSMELE